MSSTRTPRSVVGDALTALRCGRPVIVLDDETRENEGDFVIAAEKIDAAGVNLMIREGRGLVCVAAAPSVIDRLDLPQMVRANSDSHGTAFTVSVDAVGTGTGISAAHRAVTIRALTDPDTRPQDLRSPGHVFPLRAAQGGVRERRGHTEAAVELVTMAGLAPVAAICEVLDADGDAANREHLEALAGRLDIPILHVGDVDAAVRAATSRADDGRLNTATASIPSRHGMWRATAYRAPDGVEHLALLFGNVGASTPLVRVHSECLTGDVLGSLRCDCGEQLDAAMTAIAAEGVGVVVYLRGHEGRGIGLLNKIRAYSLQESGCDTVEANTRLGLPVDARDYTPAADLLISLGVHEVRLLTNNPDKVDALRRSGISLAEVIPLEVPARPENERYLATKRHWFGHGRTPPAGEMRVLPALPRDNPRTEGTRAC